MVATFVLYYTSLSIPPPLWARQEGMRMTTPYTGVTVSTVITEDDILNLSWDGTTLYGLDVARSTQNYANLVQSLVSMQLPGAEVVVAVMEHRHEFLGPADFVSQDESAMQAAKRAFSMSQRNLLNNYYPWFVPTPFHY
jgi:hypothetical protein